MCREGAGLELASQVTDIRHRQRPVCGLAESSKVNCRGGILPPVNHRKIQQASRAHTVRPYVYFAVFSIKEISHVPSTVPQMAAEDF